MDVLLSSFSVNCFYKQYEILLASIFLYSLVVLSIEDGLLPFLSHFTDIAPSV